VLIEICEHGKTDAARSAAASARWGKAQQNVDGNLTIYLQTAHRWEFGAGVSG